MLKLKPIGVDSFIKKLRQQEVSLKTKVAIAKRKLIKDVFTDLVSGSPQWSGNLATNWYIEFSGTKGSYKPDANYKPDDYKSSDRFIVGDDPAVTDTLNRELSKLPHIGWNTDVTIVNYTPYAEEVESGKGPGWKAIRKENLKYGQIAMVGYVMTKYKSLRGVA